MEAVATPSADPLWEEYLEALREQQQIDALLRRGIIFSLVWLGGIGSTYSFVCAVRAFRIKRRSPYQLRGTLRGLWCLFTGGAGALFLVWVLVTFVMYLAGYEVR
jgi:hypothetical protein